MFTKLDLESRHPLLSSLEETAIGRGGTYKNDACFTQCLKGNSAVGLRKATHPSLSCAFGDLFLFFLPHLALQQLGFQGSDDVFPEEQHVVGH